MSSRSLPADKNKTPIVQEVIPFNVPYTTGLEFVYMPQAVTNKHTAGDGPFSFQCKGWIEKSTGVLHTLMVNSCTSALEIAALLLELKPGDEVIMTPYTYVATANAVVKAGGVPVFVDIRPDTLNIDEGKIEEAINERTKAILVVHYSAVACEMDTIVSIAQKHNLVLIEDAAHCIFSSYKGVELGTIGQLSTFSFHETKNLCCGEGGALNVNLEKYYRRAEIIRHGGTNRARFIRGEVDKYTWVDVGSAYMMSDLNAAYLWGQFCRADQILHARTRLWQRYHQNLQEGEDQGLFRRPVVPTECIHNGHLYYLLFHSREERDFVIRYMSERGIHPVSHYMPLHDSEGGRKFGKTCGVLQNASDLPHRLLRLPLFVSMADRQQDRVVEILYEGMLKR
ncbi:MAG: dTDP-4-amino-4,6-dideoxygalactose transaminase [Desulfuromonadaceae bacterium]|nr:dTDP-4-amino-4,6-dideoxygalactose transaminase [Desulfuromonadaceae bacterium]